MEQNYGLMFIGDVGSGKSYMAACIANSLTFDENITYKRIYDRLRKVCIPIGMENRNLRQEDSIEHNSRGITELLVIDEGTNENKNSEWI